MVLDPGKLDHGIPVVHQLAVRYRRGRGSRRQIRSPPRQLMASSPIRRSFVFFSQSDGGGGRVIVKLTSRKSNLSQPFAVLNL